MKKVNFEAGERVDAPDANALSDVVHEEFNRVISHLLLDSGYTNPSEFGSFFQNVDADPNDNWLLDDLRMVSLGLSCDIKTQPSPSAAAYQLTIGLSRSGVIAGGNFVGDSTEAPVVDLGPFADDAVGNVSYIMGRVKFKAGVAENRARWRSDLNPPREEIYRANTRRIPVFDAELYSENNLPPASDGWFKIAKVTRTAETTPDLRRFKIEDQRFILTEGGHAYQKALSASRSAEYKALTEEEPSLKPFFGRGIMQTISGTDTIISYPVSLVEVLPAKSVARSNVGEDQVLGAYVADLKRPFADRTVEAGAIAGLFTLIRRSNYSPAIANLPDIRSVGDFMVEVIRVLNMIQYGRDNFGSEDAQTLSSAGVRSKRVLGWRNDITRTSLAANNADFIYGFSVDAACNELIPAQAFTTTGGGLPASLFLAKYLLAVKPAVDAVASSFFRVAFSGFYGRSEFEARDTSFGGTASDKGVSTFRKEGGIVISGGNPADGTLESLEDCATGNASSDLFSPTKGRTVYGNGAVVRKAAKGSPLAWASVNQVDSQLDLELTIDGLNFTDLCPIFSWEDFISRTSITDGAAVSLSYTSTEQNYVDTADLTLGSLIYANTGGLTVRNCWVAMFHSTNLELGGNITVRDSGLTRPVSMLGSAVCIELRNTDFTKPIVFQNVQFLRSKTQPADASVFPNSQLIRINGAAAEVEEALPRVVFDSCFFTDFLAEGQNAGNSLRLVPTSAPSVLDFFQIEEEISHLVTFKNCTFNCGVVSLYNAKVEGCTFLPAGTTEGRVLVSMPQRRTANLDNDPIRPRLQLPKKLAEESLTVGQHIHGSVVSAGDVQLMPYSTGGFSDVNDRVVEITNNLREYDAVGDQFIVRGSSTDRTDPVDTPACVSSIYRFGAGFVPVSSVQFRQVSGNEDESQQDRYKGVYLEAEGLLKLSGGFPSPVLADRSLVNSTFTDEDTSFLSHSSYAQDGSMEKSSDITVGVPQARPVRSVATTHGNVSTVHSVTGINDALIAARNPTRGFAVERPLEGAANPIRYYANVRHPWTDSGYNLAEDFTDTGEGLQNPEVFKQVGASVGTYTLNEHRLVGCYQERTHLQAEVMRLSTPSMEAFDPILGSTAGVTRRTSTSLRLHGAVHFGEAVDSFFVRGCFGGGKTSYREAKFNHTINDANHHIGMITDASGELSNMAFIARSDLHPQGYLELDLASETAIASPNATQISKLDGDLGQLSLVVAGLQNERFNLGNMMRSRPSRTGIYGDLWRVTSAHANIESYNTIDTLQCVDVRLSLVPIAGYRYGIRYRILAEKVLQNGDVVRGLLHFNDDSGNSLRDDASRSLWSNNANGFTPSKPSVLSGVEPEAVLEFTVDLYYPL